MSDPINPDHYRNHPSGVECIQVSEHFTSNVGQAIQYLWRHEDKGTPVEDLRKAAWFANREADRLERKMAAQSPAQRVSDTLSAMRDCFTSALDELPSGMTEHEEHLSILEGEIGE